MIPGIVAAQSRRAGAPVGGDPYWSSVGALLHFEGGDGSTSVLDEKGSIWFADNGAVLSTASKRFGDSALYLPDDASRLRSGLDPSLTPFAGDFTIEAYISLAILRRSSIFHRNSSASGGGYFEVGPQNTLRMIVADGSYHVVAGATQLAAQQWHHVAATKESNVIRLFLNGVLDAEQQVPGAGNTTAQAFIGYDNAAAGRGFIGHIDEFRFTAAARYTADFTPPQAPFPNFGS